jgi:hypothetical protein
MKTPKAKIKPKKTGRPSKFDSINTNQLKKLVLKGFTDVEIADFFGITRQTLDNYKKQKPEFFASLKEWKLEADDKVERALFESACGYRTTYKKNMVVSDGKDMGSHIEKVTEEVAFPPNATSCIFWLKNRKPEQYRETPPPALDPRFEDAELIFTGVPNQRSAAAEKEFAKYYDQN